jgi:hypothetical protein
VNKGPGVKREDVRRLEEKGGGFWVSSLPLPRQSEIFVGIEPPRIDPDRRKAHLFRFEMQPKPVQAIPEVVVQEVLRSDFYRAAFDTEAIEHYCSFITICFLAFRTKKKEVFSAFLLADKPVFNRAFIRGIILRHSGCPLAEHSYRVN